MLRLNWRLLNLKRRGVFFACIGGVVLALLSVYFLLPNYKVGKYYDVLRAQESVIFGTKLSDQHRDVLLSCKSDACYREFFDKYTMENGIAQAFSLLALFQKEYPERSRGCHYISHGIGHAALRTHEKNLTNAFAFMKSSLFYKNVSTCGNGYFHGVIEELAKDTRSEVGLIALLKNVCEVEGTFCFHGIGHALSIQLNDDIDAAVRVCGVISNSNESRFECYTGLFMEQTSIASVNVRDGIMNFSMCNEQVGAPQVACYLEQSSLYERFTENPENYVRNIGFCRQITDPLNRMGCVKLFAIRSVRIAYFEDVHEMCLNTSSAPERIMCTGVVASKLAKSISSNSNSTDYSRRIWDICGTLLNPLRRLQCFDLVTSRPQQLFYTSIVDLTIAKLSGEIFSNVYSLYGI